MAKKKRTPKRLYTAAEQRKRYASDCVLERVEAAGARKGIRWGKARR